MLLFASITLRPLPMDNVHHLRTSTDSQARLLEQWITETISHHPDKYVAARWAQMARETARKFPGPPTPSRTDIDLNHLQSLSGADKERLFAEVDAFVGSYFDDVRQQLMQVHGELLRLQKQVAELEKAAKN